MDESPERGARTRRRPRARFRVFAVLGVLIVAGLIYALVGGSGKERHVLRRGYKIGPYDVPVRDVDDPWWETPEGQRAADAERRHLEQQREFDERWREERYRLRESLGQ